MRIPLPPPVADPYQVIWPHQALHPVDHGERNPLLRHKQQQNVQPLAYTLDIDGSLGQSEAMIARW